MSNRHDLRWVLVVLVIGCQPRTQKPVAQPAPPVSSTTAYQPVPQERSFGYPTYIPDAPSAHPVDPSFFAQREDVAPPPVFQPPSGPIAASPAFERPATHEEVAEFEKSLSLPEFPTRIGGIAFGADPGHLVSACSGITETSLATRVLCQQLPEPLDFAKNFALLDMRAGRVVIIGIATDPNDALERLTNKYGPPSRVWVNDHWEPISKRKYSSVSWELRGGVIILDVDKKQPKGRGANINLTFVSQKYFDLEDHGF